MILLAIDPGANQGFAGFTDGVLTHAGLGLPDLEPDELLVEKPVHRPGAPTPVNDLLELAIHVGIAIGRYHRAAPRLFRPTDWKASVPKHIHHPRILARLTPAELAVDPEVARYAARLPKMSQKQRICAARAKVGNTVDAVGLGLFALQRMGRGA